MPTLNLADLLFSPTRLILIAASAALLIAIGVLYSCMAFGAAETVRPKA